MPGNSNSTTHYIPHRAKSIYLFIYLSILFLGLVAISSCQENGQEELKEGLETMLKNQDPVAYENKVGKIKTANFPELKNQLSALKAQLDISGTLISSKTTELSLNSFDLEEALLKIDKLSGKQYFSFQQNHTDTQELYSLLAIRDIDNIRFFIIEIDFDLVDFKNLKFNINNALKLTELLPNSENKLSRKNNISYMTCSANVYMERDRMADAPSSSTTTGADYTDEYLDENFSEWVIVYDFSHCNSYMDDTESGSGSGSSDGGGDSGEYLGYPYGSGGGSSTGTTAFPIYSSTMLTLLEDLISQESDPTKRREKQLTHIYNFYGDEGRFFAMSIANDFVDRPGIQQKDIDELNRIVDAYYKYLLELRARKMMGSIKPVMEVSYYFIEFALWETGAGPFYLLAKSVLASRYAIPVVKFAANTVKSFTQITQTIKNTITVAANYSNISIKLGSKVLTGTKGTSATTYIVRDASKAEVELLFKNLTNGGKGVSIKEGQIIIVDLEEGGFIQLRKFAKSTETLGEHWTIQCNRGL